MAKEAEEKAGDLEGGGPVFSEHITIEILSRLPVKILMRLKCICKSWYSIISTPTSYFISRHLRNYYHNKNHDDHGCLLIQYNNRPDSDITALFLDPTLADLRHHHLDVPLPNTYMLGPCDGIYFIECNQRFYALWNPATQDCKLLPETPKPNFPLCRFYYESYGFGFDQKTQGFKVVIIRVEGYQCCGKSFPSEVLIYSGNSNSWCHYEVPWDFCVDTPSTCHTYLYGVYYWKASDEEGEFVLSFDMATNLFHRVISATAFENNSDSIVVLYRDSIAWFKFEEENLLHMWVMDQDENCCSWIKKISLGPFLHNQRPIGFWRNDQLILEDFDGVCLYNLTSGTVKGRKLGITINDISVCYMILIYKESLVRINGEKLVPGEISADWRERFLENEIIPPCIGEEEEEFS